jgi:MSHA biogenesis protein MshN
MSPTDNTANTPDSAKKPAALARLKLSKQQIRNIMLAAIALAAVGGAGYWWETHKAQPGAAPVKAAQSAPQPVVQPASPPATIQESPRAASSPVATGAIAEPPPKTAAPEEKPLEPAIAALREAEIPPRPRNHSMAAIPKHKPAPKEEEEAPAPGASVAAPEPLPSGSIDKQEKQLTPQQMADNEFRRANGLAEQGKMDEAEGAYEAALHLDPGHEAARQALAMLLIGDNRHPEAEHLLQEGLNRNLKNTGAAMLLARLQLERDAAWTALLTLQKSLPYAEQQADYQAFVAGLLQRLNHHKEAVAHYREAVRLAPASGVWYMGLGISLQTLARYDEAREAFQRALDTRSLNADLEAFTTQRLKELKRR